jgi:hypothetical protein
LFCSAASAAQSPRPVAFAPPSALRRLLGGQGCFAPCVCVCVCVCVCGPQCRGRVVPKVQQDLGSAASVHESERRLCNSNTRTPNKLNNAPPCLMVMFAMVAISVQFMKKRKTPCRVAVCHHGFLDFFHRHGPVPLPDFRIFSPLSLVSQTNQNRIPAISLAPIRFTRLAAHKRRRLWLVYRTPYSPQPTSPNPSITSQFCHFVPPYAPLFHPTAILSMHRKAVPFPPDPLSSSLPPPTVAGRQHRCCCCTRARLYAPAPADRDLNTTH